MKEPSSRPLFSLGKRKGDQPPLVRVDARSLAYFAVILIMIGLAGWLYLQQASQVATYAHEIRRIERDKEKTHREMIALKAQVAEAGSLERILGQAQAAGYSLPKSSEDSRLLILEVAIDPEPPQTDSTPIPDVTETPNDSVLGRGLVEDLRAWLHAEPDRYRDNGWQ